MEAQAARMMPKYKCHKEVWALKIADVILDAKVVATPPGGALITPAEDGYAPFAVDAQYVLKHFSNLQREQIIGGYYVVYQDGYKSFSPAQAFEEGYTLIR
jgi:hypothetical protein